MIDDTLFPTRDGKATGHANERTMLDVVGDPNQFRTVLRKTGNKTTRMRTRGGFVEYVTSEEVEAVAQDCIKGPFFEREQGEVSYSVRAGYAGASVQSWGGLINFAVKAIKHIVLENAIGKRLLFAFRWKDEPASTELPVADLTFREIDFSSREYYPEKEDSGVVSRNFMAGINTVYGRLKIVVAAINTIGCEDGRTIGFDDANSGENPVTQGCVNSVLREPYSGSRGFDQDGWITRLLMITGTGGCDLNFLQRDNIVNDIKGFLSPLDVTGNGEEIACSDIPAVGTRIIGINVQGTVHLNSGSTRSVRGYEQVDSDFVYWLRPRLSDENKDRFGNVEGVLWRPGSNGSNYGPDLVAYSPFGRWPRTVLTVDGNDALWSVSFEFYDSQHTSIDDASLALQFRNMATDGVAYQSVTVSVPWTPAMTAYVGLMNGDYSVRIIDVSRHGDRVLIGWMPDNGQGPVMLLEVRFSFSQITSLWSGECAWIYTEKPVINGEASEDRGLVTGAYYRMAGDEQTSIRLLVVALRTNNISTGLTISPSGGSTSLTSAVYLGVADISPANIGAIPAYAWQLSSVTTTTRIIHSVTHTNYSDPEHTIPISIVATESISTVAADFDGIVIGTSNTDYPGQSFAIGLVSSPFNIDEHYISDVSGYVSPGCYFIGMPSGNNVFYFCRGELKIPDAVIDATLRSNFSVQQTDTRHHTGLYNPVTGSLTVVGVPFSGSFDPLSVHFV